MHQGKYVFSQIMEFAVRFQFDQCVNRYKGNRWIKNFSCWEQFLALAFGQLSFRESLRDIVVCLGAHRENYIILVFVLLLLTILYHMPTRNVIGVSSETSQKF